jgi:RNA-directed DNA polymerase
MSQLAKLKSAKTRKELAQILGYKPSSLTAIIYKTPASLKYTTFEIDKKSGGKRTIKAPNPKLKKLQSHLSHVLYQCLNEIEEARQAKPLSFGFRQDRSIAPILQFRPSTRILPQRQRLRSQSRSSHNYSTNCV